ncbi:flagellin [Caldifermentibacillus hisashii]|uniref:flagellin N-terminal helical domain-containing protein n=1 Tax=Caldifermentibacillus hisashii TaxID=996558 RepID=UPI0031FDA56D
MISLIQTAEGALNETHAILQRMRELAVQAANDTNTDTDRAELQKEVDQLAEELDRIGNNTEFNTKTLLDGSLGTDAKLNKTNTTIIENVKFNDKATAGTGAYKVTEKIDYAAATAGGAFQSVEIDIQDSEDNSLGKLTFSAQDVKDGKLSKTLKTDDGVEITVEVSASLLTKTGDGEGSHGTADTVDVTKSSLSFQIGANSGQNIELTLHDMRSDALGVDAIDLTNKDSANQAITQINNAIETVSAERSKFGAVQNRLEHTINNLGTSSENLTAAESRIRDVDYALAA